MPSGSNNQNSNDSTLDEVKDNVEQINENIESIAKNGVKVNDNRFDSLANIVDIERNLEKAATDTHHIRGSLHGNSNFVRHITEIRDEIAGLRTFLTNSNGNQHITSQGASSNGVSIGNTSEGQEMLGGFSDVVNKIYDELKSFRSEVVTILGEIPLGLDPNATFEDIKDYLQKIADAKQEISKEQKVQEDEEKTKESYWKKQKQQRKAEERAKRRGERDAGEIAWKHAGHLVNLGTSIAQGATSDQVLNNTVGKISGALSNLPGPWGAVAGGALQGIKALFDLYAKQDKEASEYARTIGGSQFGKNQMIRVANSAAGLAPAKYGLNQEDIMKQAKETAEALGRSVSNFSSQSLISSGILKKMGIGADAINNFDTYGKSIQQTDRYFNDLYKQVSKRGLSFKNVSKAVNDNLKSAQLYSFSRGLKGLEAMAERSTQLKFNMQQAMTFADKVSDFESAIKTSANLSVLGGSFTQFSNPMQMMYEGLNDVEALQDRIVKMYGGLARYDTNKQEIAINPEDLKRLKAAAEAMGLDKNEMVTMAKSQARFNMVESQISDKGMFNKDTIEYIKNLSELGPNGQASITLNGKQKAVSALTSADAALINTEAKNKEDKNSASMGDIFVHTKSISETLDDMLKYLQTKLGMWVAKIAGVKFDGAASRGYWRNLSGDEKDALIARYGGRHEAKLAVGMGEETEKVNSALGRDKYEGDLVREFLNQKAEKTTGRKNKVARNLNSDWKKGNLDNEFERWLDNRFVEKEAGGIIQGNYHVDGGTPAIYNGKPVEIEKDETLFGKDVLHTYGSDFLRNIKDHNVPTISSVNGVYYNPMPLVGNNNLIQPRNSLLQNVATGILRSIYGNVLNPLSVAPTQVLSQPEKISFDTFKVEIGGKIDLTSNDKTKTLDVTKLSQTDLDKLTSMIYKQVYNEISRRINKGFDKESNPFRGA